MYVDNEVSHKVLFLGCNIHTLKYNNIITYVFDTQKLLCKNKKKKTKNILKFWCIQIKFHFN